MEWLGCVLSFIQNNKLLYLFCVAIFLGGVSLILNEGQHKADKNKEKTEKQPWKNQASAKRKHMIITFCLCFLAALIPLAVSMYYPFVETSDVATDVPDGYIKLSFYDGKFAYRNYVGQEVYNENDVNSPSDRSYFEDPIAPLVYITITDASNQVIYDDRSEHIRQGTVLCLETKSNNHQTNGGWMTGLPATQPPIFRHKHVLYGNSHSNYRHRYGTDSKLYLYGRSADEDPDRFYRL